MDYKPANAGDWHTVNEAYSVKHSVALKGLTPGTRYNYVAWASGAVKMPPSTFTTSLLGASVISSVQLASSGSEKLTEKPGITRLILLIGLPILAVLGCVLAIRKFFRRRLNRHEKPDSLRLLESPVAEQSTVCSCRPNVLLIAEKVNKEEDEGRSRSFNQRPEDSLSGQRRSGPKGSGMHRPDETKTVLIEEALKALIRKEALSRLPSLEPEQEDLRRSRIL